ncbi:MAG: 50S ribosomal protein L6 [Mycoplasmataceae bacterium]|jgi:large subunit ribosomal protein L6|nr:50S ribosomal protein L6 [Mycoplasmataceae bacterium]
MSRKGNKPLKIPTGTTIEINENDILVKGSLGTLVVPYTKALLEIKQTQEGIEIIRRDNEKRSNIMQGTIGSNLLNAIKGVTLGFTKKLKIVGVGYKAILSGEILEVHAGYFGSGPRRVQIPKNLKVTVPSQTEIVIFGFDKQLVGEFTAKIRDIRRPEPYKGKGIMYSDEIIIRKVGKTAEGGKKAK